MPKIDRDRLEALLREPPEPSVLIDEYYRLLRDLGWENIGQTTYTRENIRSAICMRCGASVVKHCAAEHSPTEHCSMASAWVDYCHDLLACLPEEEAPPCESE